MAPHKALTLCNKVAIIRDIQNGKKQCKVAETLNLAKSTVQKVWSQREKILQNYAKVNPNIKKIRKCAFPKTDAALVKWFELQQDRNLPISGILLMEQAKEFALKLGEDGFKGSNGWIQKWKLRHKFRLISDEAEDVSGNICISWLTDIWPKYGNSYPPKDIFNLDETGLFYKLLPNKTVTRKDQLCAGGKLSKERVTVLLCANADGTEKLKPVVIGKYEHPRCFRGLNKASLPVDYYWHSKAWITPDIFSKWLKKLDMQMKLKKRKILILLSNCHPHRIKDKLRNIVLVFLPLNVKPDLHPMQQGIINETKQNYRKIVLQKISEKQDSKLDHNIDLLEGITTLALAWEKIQNKTVKNCFSLAKIIGCDFESTDVEDENTNTNKKDCQQLLVDKATEDFFLVDLEVATHDAQPVDDIIKEISGKKQDNGNIENNSDGEDDQEIERPVISTSEAIKYIDDIKTWVRQQDKDSKNAFAAIHSLEDFALKAKRQKLN